VGLLTEPGRGKLDALTSLRFVAALLVFTWHCVPMHQISATFSLGYVGVGFFFLLSGFILTYSYRTAFATGIHPAALRAFYAARFARIVPLHLVTMPPLILTMVYFGNPLWTGVGAQTRLTEIAAQAVLMQSWFAERAVHFGGNGPSWSISVEAFFYALFPLLAFVMLRAFRKAPPRAVLAVAFGVWLLQVAVLSPQHASVDDWRFYVFPPARLADFVVGMLIGVAVVRGDPAGRWRLRGTSMEMLAVTAVAISIVFSPLLPLALQFSAVLMPAWAFAIYVFAARRGAISRVLEHPVLVRLGEVSFAFYLIHLAVIVSLTQWLGTSHPLFVPLALGITLAVSFALFHGVEQPLRIRIRRAFAGAGTPRSAADRGERAPGVAVPLVEQRGFHVQPREAV
jgi:peptidoglycan/LPS O-acetylase OafA/YrhL